uniref:MATH domain-containing protein n=1 Tax=Manihot esculenta TaxID=3983 RepID=A0A199UC08_MANES
MGDATPFKFTWRINNFSTLTPKELHSEVFYAGGCQWCLLVFPKGNKVDYLSMYLEVADSTSLPQGWSRDAEFNLAVVNQINNSLTVRKYTEHVFKAFDKDWGFTSFIPLSKIKNSAEGYLVGDTLILEVEILVRSVKHYSKPEPKKQEAKDETKPSEPVAAPPTSQVPSSEKVVDTKAKVDTKPLNQTKEGIQATATPTSDKEVIKSSPPPSVTVETKILPKDPPSEPVKSSQDVHATSKGLLTELASRTRTMSSETSMSNQASKPDVQKQKEALKGFLNMPLEAIQLANAYGNIEGIILTLIQHSKDLNEKTILQGLLSCLAEFKESVPMVITTAETAQARRTSLSEKTADLDAKLAQRHEELSSKEAEFLRLSTEEEKLEAEIQLLIKQKEVVVARKKSVLVELEKSNKEASKDLEEWKKLESEIKQANVNWVGAQEKLALANVRWKLYKEDLGLGKLNIS